MSPEQHITSEGYELIAVSREQLNLNLADIIAYGIPVWRKNIEGVMVPIPADKLERYVGEQANEFMFYLQSNWKERIRPQRPAPSRGSVDVPVLIKKIAQYGEVAKQAERFRLMSVPEREEILDQSLEKLIGIRDAGHGLDLEAVVGMVEVTAYTLYAHHANLEDVTEEANLRNNVQGIINKSKWALNILIDMLRQGLLDYRDYALIEDIATKSHTFDHIVRVLLKFISFCMFFNHYIDKGLVTKEIRATFRDRFARYYKKRLDLPNLSIETVFKDGIRRIDEEKELPDYAMGALLFDMGKLPDLHYHDSHENGYDEKTVKKHVLNGFNMIVRKKSYPFTVLAMTAFHHELYGSKTGYNFTNAILSKLYNIKRNEESARYFITYDEKEFIRGTALAFFPVKMLEVVDIFDAMVHKREKPAAEALLEMKKEFITRSLKIDPVIFMIFLEFNRTCGLIDRNDFEKIDSMIY